MPISEQNQFMASSAPSATVIRQAQATAIPANTQDLPTAQATPRIELTTIPDEIPAPLAAAPISTVTYYEEEVTLLTYPFERYQADAIDPRYQWPYKRFDIDRYRAEAPVPDPRSYRLLVLENVYLKITILPELGGRIWQVIHKPSGAPVFYQNEVVKPTHWGNPQQLGWLALGGIEWGLPVIEHGYDWGTAWNYQSSQQGDTLAMVTVSTPNDGRLLKASITISLRANEAVFEIAPTITNIADHAVDFSYWHDAMLAPGTGKKSSADLQLILPTDAMTIHSTFDDTMPQPGGRFSWPIYQGRDLSRLGNYTQYMGFFEAPRAHGPFAAIYDPQYDIGVVRISPPNIMRGSKVFVLGWQDQLGSDNFADDDSAYVELHSGLAPTFDDRYHLAAGETVSWQELWYPAQGISTIHAANELVALRADRTTLDVGEEKESAIEIGIYSTRPVTGTVEILADTMTAPGQTVEVAESTILAAEHFQSRPDAPYQALVPVAQQCACDENRSLASSNNFSAHSEQSITTTDAMTIGCRPPFGDWKEGPPCASDGIPSMWNAPMTIRLLDHAGHVLLTYPLLQRNR